MSKFNGEFEAGKYYRTYGDEKLKCVGVNDFNYDYPYVLCDQYEAYLYNSEGEIMAGLPVLNIRCEWKDDSKWKVTAYGEDVFYTYKACNASMYKSLGYEVECVQGEELEDE